MKKGRRQIDICATAPFAFYDVNDIMGEVYHLLE
jgi:hypothetical protein